MRAAAVSPAGAACVGNVITSVVSTCLYYRLLWALQSSPAFGVQLCTFMQAVVCGALLLLARCVGVKRPPAAPKFRAWLELSVWFSLQNTLEIAAVDGLGPANGNLTPVLQQAVIPVTIVLSSVLLRQTFCRLHWMAAGIVIVGIVASYAPLLLTNAESIRPKWGWAVLFLGSRLPQAIGNVRCEAVLLPLASADKAEVAADDGGGSPAVARRRQSVQLLLACGFWTASLGLALNFISSVMLACIRGLGAASVLDDYSSGARCLLNLNATAASTDPCRAAPGATAAFALPGVLFAISEFQVLQLASAASYFLLMALELPLQAAALAAPPIMGSLASAYHPSLFYGVPLVALGLILWAYAERTLVVRRPTIDDGQVQHGGGEGVLEPQQQEARSEPLLRGS